MIKNVLKNKKNMLKMWLWTFNKDEVGCGLETFALDDIEHCC